MHTVVDVISDVYTVRGRIMDLLLSVAQVCSDSSGEILVITRSSYH